MTELTLGSLFDGIGGFPLAAVRNGIRPLWASEIERALLIRRLTPLECERLQGFPDGWTEIPGAADSARYRALGNSVAVPCVDFIMKSLREVVELGL